MGTLAAALEWARRGFSVFPLRENSKEPAFDSWLQLATNDAEAIRQLWLDPVLRTERDYNIGCLCSGYVVVDVDVKDGKDGYNEYSLMGGTWDTLTVRTPSGGWHLYFYGPDSSNKGVSPSVDIRSYHGFVVAPGSTIDGQRYEVVNEHDMVWVSGGVEKLLQPPEVRKDYEGFDCVLDDPASVQMAINLLQTTPPAIEGQRGDEITFIVAARLVREMALSPVTAFQLMCEYFNPRCVPAWEPKDLWVKVENAAAYGSADRGRLAPATLFQGIAIEPPPTVFKQASVDFGNAFNSDLIKPRPWLIERMLLTGAITLMLAAGSAGKSSLSLALAAHMALGATFAGFKPKRACKVIVYNGEDDVDEQSRRLIALCVTYGFNYAEVAARVMLLSSRELKLMLVRKEGGRALRDEALVNQLTELASDPEVGLLVLDPLVRIHQCNENDSVEMDFVMETLTDIAYKSSTAILALHHTPKMGNRNEDRAGNPDISRGAGSIVNAARIAFTLLPASTQDIADYGISETESNMYVRLDDAKMNFTLAGDKATWFKKHSVCITSRDMVGVLYPVTLDFNKQHVRVKVAKIILDEMQANNTASITVLAACAIWKNADSFGANKTEHQLRRELESYFTSGVNVAGKTLMFIRDEGSKASLVMR